MLFISVLNDEGNRSISGQTAEFFHKTPNWVTNPMNYRGKRWIFVTNAELSQKALNFC